MSNWRLEELLANGWAAELDDGRVCLTAEGGRSLLALTDAKALELVRQRIEGTL